MWYCLVSLFATRRNGSWVSVSVTTRPPSSITMPSLKTPAPLVIPTLQQAGLSARCCSRGVCGCVKHLHFVYNEYVNVLVYFSPLSAFFTVMCFRLAERIQHEHLKSDFTIDLKHEVLWNNFLDFQESMFSRSYPNYHYYTIIIFATFLQLHSMMTRFPQPMGETGAKTVII